MASLKVLGALSFVEINPTIDTNAYQAGDVVGGVMTIPVGQKGGMLRHVKLVDNDAEAAELSLYLFRDTPTAILDDAAFAAAMTEADTRLLIDQPLVFATTDYLTLNAEKYAIKGGHGGVGNTGLGIELRPVDTNIYAYAVCTATPTYAALKLFWQFTLWRNDAG